MNHMDPPVFIAARMSSARLPGKVLMDFGGHPLLSYVVAAASEARKTSGVVVVSSRDPSDDPIVEWCEANQVNVWRGDLENVAGRMLGAAAHFGVPSFVRLSGDSPMIDPAVISYAVSRFTSRRMDLLTNVEPRTFPPGQSVEVLRAETLERLLTREKTVAGDLEHVTPLLYRHGDQISISRFAPIDVPATDTGPDGPYRSMTVDTPADAECFRRVLQQARDPHVWKLGWRQCGKRMLSAQHDVNGS